MSVENIMMVSMPSSPSLYPPILLCLTLSLALPLTFVDRLFLYVKLNLWLGDVSKLNIGQLDATRVHLIFSMVVNFKTHLLSISNITQTTYWNTGLAGPLVHSSGKTSRFPHYSYFITCFLNGVAIRHNKNMPTISRYSLYTLHLVSMNWFVIYFLHVLGSQVSDFLA